MKILIATTCFCAMQALAAPACTPGTYAAYEALSAGCSIGSAVFSSFSGLSFVNSPGVAPVTQDDIMITPTGGVGDAMLAFNYVDSKGNASPVTLNQLGQIFSFGFNFQVTAVLTGIQMNSTFGNTSPGSASATKTAQLLGGGPTYTSTVSDGGVSNPVSTYDGLVIPVAGSGTFLVTDTTSLQAQSGSVTASGITNAFNISTTGAVDPILATPEAQTLLTVGSGLVVIGLVMVPTRRKRAAVRVN